MTESDHVQATKTILIVEDEVDLREALESAMTVAGGFNTLTAGDGEVGLEVALAEKPDMIFLDVRIPKLDGSQVLEQIRSAGDWGERVPVSILSAQSDLSAISRAMEVGDPHTNYLTKTDWSLEQLVTHVKDVLRV